MLGGTPVGRAHDAARQALASPSCIADFATAFFQLREKAHVLHQKVTGSFPTARDAVRRVRRSPPLIAPRTDDQCARNLAEAIDDLYAMTLQLVTASAYLISCRCKSKAFWQLSERQRNEEGH